MANKRIDVDAIIDRVRLAEQGANPATPSSGYGWLFEKSDGNLYFMNDAGEVIGPLGNKYYTFLVIGDLTADPGVTRVYNLTGKALLIKKVHLAVNTAPTDATIIVDVNDNDTTIFTTQSNRPVIAISGFTGESTTIEDASWANGNYLTVDVDQVGSTIAGADLTITAVCA